MVVAIFGESCTGKSTMAERLKALLDAQVYTGKDYLRLAKNEAAAKELFSKQLREAMTGRHIIYVIAEKEHLSLLPDGCVRILCSADIELIKQRFARRMGGALPPPVAAMLEKKHGCFDDERHHINVISGHSDTDAACAIIKAMIDSMGV